LLKSLNATGSAFSELVQTQYFDWFIVVIIQIAYSTIRMKSKSKTNLQEIKTWLVKPQVWVMFVVIMTVIALAIADLSMSQSLNLVSRFLDWTGFLESTEKGTSTTTEIVPNAKILAPDGTGTITKITVTDRHEPGKTLWDLMSLIVVPLSLTILAWWLQSRQNQQSEENQREEALRDYIDSISDILLDKKLFALDKKIPQEKAIQDSALDVIRARTLSILRRLNGDGKRKASVLLFLHDAELITKGDLRVVLHYADFSGADLSGAFLVNVILDGVTLNYANLRNAKLIGANLRDAKLHHADLTEANLIGAVLANTEFLSTKLNGAKIAIWAPLSQAKLCNTELPEGWDLDPNRDCEELKSLDHSF
jgi:Pentapeptide repeats (8 copies)